MTTTNRPTALSALRGVTPLELERLRTLGIDDTNELLAQAPTAAAEQKLAKAAGVDPSRLRELVNRADLVRVHGVGPVLADAFDQVGVNGARELARRNALNLEGKLDAFAQTNPEALRRSPSARTVEQLITSARSLGQTGPALRSPEDAHGVVATALSRYLDDVLFSSHPDGESFRSNVLDGQTPEVQQQVHDEMSAGIPGFLGLTTDRFSHLDEVIDQPDRYIFVGRWQGLHTEAEVLKADGKLERLLVEVD
jgi:hypothetical protein